jgi:hypothetical protein
VAAGTFGHLEIHFLKHSNEFSASFLDESSVPPHVNNVEGGSHLNSTMTRGKDLLLLNIYHEQKPCLLTSAQPDETLGFD